MAVKKTSAEHVLPSRTKKPVKAVTPANAPASKRAPAAATELPAAKKRKVADGTAGEAKRAPNGTARPSAATSAAKKSKTATKVVLTSAPKQAQEVFVFGGNSGAELGLGDTATSASVKRPRLNPNLPASTVGVVHVAVGGMHSLALTKDNTILSWGVNDLGALGRDTNWSGGLVDMKDDEGDSSDDDDEGEKLNPVEATPTAIDTSAMPKGTVFTQLAASDNASFALTDEGRVYGWGTFRGNDGVIGFSPTVNQQNRPVLLDTPRDIVKITTGEDHVLALDNKGNVHVWGGGEQAQLGRRIMERTRLQALLPRRIGTLKNIVEIGAGSKHSFAIDNKGLCYAWGQNNYGQTGITGDAGESGATTESPKQITELNKYGPISMLGGGNSHSFAVTAKGECLVWGRLDACATGQDVSKLPEDAVIRDERGKPRILKVPTELPGLGEVACVASGAEHCIAIAKDGKAFAWGFSEAYRTGLGTDDDVPTPLRIENTAVREKHLVWAGAGGQFSVVTAAAS